MKKKFRLLTTIASISLALGLMVFGILAATNVTVGVSSTVTYTAEGIAFKLYGTVELLSAKPTGTASSVSGSEANLLANVNIQSNGTETATLADKEFTEANRWVVMTFTVKNMGSNVLGRISVTPKVLDDNLEATTDNQMIDANLEYGQEASFRVYYYLKNINRSVNDGQTAVDITLLPPQTIANLTFVCDYSGRYDKHFFEYSTDNGNSWIMADEESYGEPYSGSETIATVNLVDITQIKVRYKSCGYEMGYPYLEVDGVKVWTDDKISSSEVTVTTDNIEITKSCNIIFHVGFCDL